jgi:hypothetical protein
LHAPVCIEADAIAPGKPRRDLWVTPDHAVHCGGSLIPVKLLVNGRSIRQVSAPSFRIHHLELDRHDLILAEGLEVESYLDVGRGRRGFASIAQTLEPLTATETIAAYRARGYLPLCLEPDQVRPVWSEIAARSSRPMAVTRWTSEPCLCLEVDGIPISPSSVEGNVHWFTLRQPAASGGPGWMTAAGSGSRSARSTA